MRPRWGPWKPVDKYLCEPSAPVPAWHDSALQGFPAEPSPLKQEARGVHCFHLRTASGSHPCVFLKSITLFFFKGTASHLAPAYMDPNTGQERAGHFL